MYTLYELKHPGLLRMSFSLAHILYAGLGTCYVYQVSKIWVKNIGSFQKRSTLHPLRNFCHPGREGVKRVKNVLTFYWMSGEGGIFNFLQEDGSFWNGPFFSGSTETKEKIFCQYSGNISTPTIFRNSKS